MAAVSVAGAGVVAGAGEAASGVAAGPAVGGGGGRACAGPGVAAVEDEGLAALPVLGLSSAGRAADLPASGLGLAVSDLASAGALGVADAAGVVCACATLCHGLPPNSSSVSSKVSAAAPFLGACSRVMDGPSALAAIGSALTDNAFGHCRARSGFYASPPCDCLLRLSKPIPVSIHST